MHEVLVNHLGGLSLPRKSVARLTDRPDMTLAVYRGRKTTIQQQQQQSNIPNIIYFRLYSNVALSEIVDIYGQTQYRYKELGAPVAQ